MITLRLIMIICSILFILCACGNENDSFQATMKETQTEMDNFFYRLVTEKSHYDDGEPVKIYAELTYVGDDPFILIGHAASLFYYDLVEHDRDFEIPYVMNDPYIETTLRQNTSIQEPYIPTGGYSDQDSVEYKAFIIQLLEQQTFPPGRYTMKGNAQFTVVPTDEKFQMHTELKFTVGQSK